LGGDIPSPYPHLPSSTRYVLNAPRVEFPNRAYELRRGAAGSGTYLLTNNGAYTFGIITNNSSASIYRWETGTPSTMYNPNSSPIGTCAWRGYSDFAIFCDGDLWLDAHEGVRGRVGFGAAGNLRLMDDVLYSQVMFRSGYYPDNNDQDMVSLISEAPDASIPSSTNPPTGVLVANTPANGMMNMMNGRDIVICGSIIALNSSFTFEDQNDAFDPYICPNPPATDERGTIFVRGNIIQNRRGYVHRMNHNGTGYGRGYWYDTRFATQRQCPPFVSAATSNGFAKIKIIGWQDETQHIANNRFE